MKANTLFYTFLVIFILTAAVAILGVTNVIPNMNPTHVTTLLGTVLVAVAGAVIALYKQTDWIPREGGSLSASLGFAFGTFDRLSDEIDAAIENTAPPTTPQPHGFIVRRVGNDVVAYQRMGTVDGKTLEQLPKADRDLIKSYEKAMRTLETAWKKSKNTQASGLLDPATRQRQLNLIKGMKAELVGIVDFLQAQGLYLDDHYTHVRDLVAGLKDTNTA